MERGYWLSYLERDLTDSIAESWLIELSEADSQSWHRARKELHTHLIALTPSENLIWAALSDWVRAQNPDSARALRSTMSPSHAYWLEHCSQTRLGFARLIVETGRQRSLRDPKSPHIHSKRVQRLLGVQGLSVIDRFEHRRIRSQALAYYADDLTALGSHRLAADAIFQAKSLLGKYPAPEDHATVLQIDAIRRQDQNQGKRSLSILENAAELLEASEIAGRWSELQLVRGRILLSMNKAELAAETLTEALARLPLELAQHLRVEILMALAAALLCQKRYLEAESRLCEVNFFFSADSEELYAQQQWMLGRIALRTNRPRIAEAHLHKAIVILERLERFADLAVAMRDLIQSYIEGSRSRALGELPASYRSLLCNPEFRAALLARYPNDAQTMSLLHKAEGLDSTNPISYNKNETIH